ncbi:MAG: response regulator [Verrucomicrobiota bacterium]
MGENKLVLIIEDDERFRKMMERALQQRFEGIDIQSFADGAPAASWLGDHSPDLMLTDVCLPNYGGLELILMAQALVPHMPIMVLSGTDYLDDIQNMTGQREGMRFYHKPFELELFLNDVEHFLETDPESVIRGLSPVMLIQVIMLENKTCRMDLISGTEAGQLYFSRGQLKHARVRDMTGEAAFYELISWDHPLVQIHRGLGPPSVNVQTEVRDLIREIS